MDKSSEELSSMEVVPEKEEKNRSLKVFLGGMVFGMLTVLLVGVCVYAGKLAYDLFAVRETGTKNADGKSVISADTMQKMKVIEEAINNYYYGEEIASGELQEGI